MKSRIWNSDAHVHPESPDIAEGRRHDGRDSVVSEDDRGETKKMLEGRIDEFRRERDASRRIMFRDVVTYGLIFGVVGVAIYFIDFFCISYLSSYPALLSIFFAGFSILIIDVAIMAISTVPVDLLDLDQIMESPESKFQWLRYVSTICLLFVVYNQNKNVLISLSWWGIEAIIALSLLYLNEKYSWNHYSYKISLFFLLIPFELSIDFGTQGLHFYRSGPAASCQFHCILTSNLLAGYFFLAGIILVSYWLYILHRIRLRAGTSETAKPTVLVYVAGYGLLIICGPFHFIHSILFYFVNAKDYIFGTRELIIGFCFITPPLLVIILTRDWLFNYMSRRFDRNAENLKKDGAFIAGLLATQDVVMNQVWYVHRGKANINYRYDKTHPYNMQLYRKGRVTAINKNSFKVSLPREIVEFRNGAGEKRIETLPAKEVWLDSNGNAVSDDTTIISPPGAPDVNHDEEKATDAPLVCVINMETGSLLNWARENLRCIDWENMSQSLFERKSVRDTSTAANAIDYYSLSRELKEDEKIDYFISHAWADDGDAKFKELSKIATAHHREYKRWPTFWFDKVCFDQNNITAGLKVLPINLMSCNVVLVLCGDSYTSRLWCVWELFTLLAFVRDETEAVDKVRLIGLPDKAQAQSNQPGQPVQTSTLPLAPAPVRAPTPARAGIEEGLEGNQPAAGVGSSTATPGLIDEAPSRKRSGVYSLLALATENGPPGLSVDDDRVLSKLENFKLSESTCYDPNERKKLLRVIKAVGDEIFEQRIRKLATRCREQKLGLKKPMLSGPPPNWTLVRAVSKNGIVAASRARKHSSSVTRKGLSESIRKMLQ